MTSRIEMQETQNPFAELELGHLFEPSRAGDDLFEGYQENWYAEKSVDDGFDLENEWAQATQPGSADDLIGRADGDNDGGGFGVTGSPMLTDDPGMWPIYGTNFVDSIDGTDASDVIYAYNGSDIVYGNMGP